MGLSPHQTGTEDRTELIQLAMTVDPELIVDQHVRKAKKKHGKMTWPVFGMVVFSTVMLLVFAMLRIVLNGQSDESWIFLFLACVPWLPYSLRSRRKGNAR
jgi:hypothetical protein